MVTLILSVVGAFTLGCLFGKYVLAPYIIKLLTKGLDK